MISNYNHRVLNTKFSKWLEEDVYISKGLEYAPRKYAMYWFIQDLREFVKSEGYVFRIDQTDMAHAWARYIFRVQYGLMKGKKLQANPDDTTEDYDWFCHNFDSVAIEPFVDTWKHADDYIVNRDSELALFNVFQFAWYYINIKASSATRKVDEMYDGNDSDEDGKPRGRSTRNGKPRDPYLDDMANAASKYNRWD